MEEQAGPLQQRFVEYYPYFEEIRKRIYFVVVFFVLAFVAGFFVSIPLFRFGVAYVQIPQVAMVITSPFQFVDLAMSIGVFFASTLTLPLLLYHIFSFLGPGLTPREKRRFILYLPVAVFLFVVGFAYGCFVLYFALNAIALLNTSMGIQNYWDISKFLSEIIVTATFLGIIFQFPLILNLCVKAGLVQVEFLVRKRKYAVLFIFLFTALLPPTDGVSLLIMVLPLIFLYEITILLHRGKKNKLIYQ